MRIVIMYNSPVLAVMAVVAMSRRFYRGYLCLYIIIQYRDMAIYDSGVFSGTPALWTMGVAISGKTPRGGCEREFYGGREWGRLGSWRS